MEDEKTTDNDMIIQLIFDQGEESTDDDSWDNDILIETPSIEDFEATIQDLLRLDIYNDRGDILQIIPEIEIYLHSITPNFTCSEARNGIIEIKIKNFDQLCTFKSVISDDDWLTTSFAAVSMLRIGCIFNTHNGLSCIMDIERGHLHDDGKLFIKFPTYFTSYTVDIWLQANNDIFYAYSEPELPSKYSFVWPRSDIRTIHIPPFLSNDEYKVNETIGIPVICKDRKEIFLVNSKIAAIFDDNTYQISYGPDDQKRINIPISKLYPKRAYQVLNVGRILNKDIYRNEYIHRNDKSEFDSTVIGLWNFFEFHRRCGDPLEYSCMADYVQSMEYFLIHNICEFLFEFKYFCHVDCIRNGFDGKLRFGNIIDVRPEFVGTRSLFCWCDCCGIELNEYDYVFSCDGAQRPHLICVDCINTTIESNQELQPLIHSILSKELDIDCIGKILEFVVGRVIYR